MSEVEGDLVVLFHRWTGDFFLNIDRTPACRLTGSDLLDARRWDAPLPHQKDNPLRA